MLKKKNGLRLGAVAAAVTACLAFGTQAAYADPASGTFPELAGTGSDTIQDVLNGLGSVIPEIGSYDATGSATIQTTSGGPSFVRPNGSGQGLNALSASINSTGTKQWNSVTITDQLDFARSSSGPSVSGTELTFIPFALDTVSYAVNSASDFPRAIPLGSAAQAAVNPTALTLWNIYHCTRTSYVNNDGDSITIVPLIPQSGSGTRSFWLGRVGLTEGTLATFPCVTSLSNSVQEHNGSALTGPGHIVPFSIAQYVAQGNHALIDDETGVEVIERRSHVTLGAITGIQPLVFTGSGVSANPSFPVSRLVFNVVETARLSSGDPEDVLLQDVFAGPASEVCESEDIISLFGFAPIGNCGDTATYKSGYTL